MRTRTPQRNTFLANVLVTAVEGGVGYWSSCSGYRWRDEHGDASHPGYPAAPGGGGNAEVTLYEAEDDIAHPVTLDTVAKGLRLIREGKVAVGKTLRSWIVQDDRSNEMENIDADAADVVIQAALFGQVVYG